MIRLLLLTAAFDLAGAPLGGIAASVPDGDPGLWRAHPALWLIAIGLACVAMACRYDQIVGSQRLSLVRALA